ncbi:hypothetical protein [Indioceanicola profundi]|uniref:hypothetical protein n=1 Tax=Indioceanicola profundi TaxID=2220096 RepID=UPI000E6AC9C2|nr:hypothetical protein [Indioceanicola profundi]
MRVFAIAAAIWLALAGPAMAEPLPELRGRVVALAESHLLVATPAGSRTMLNLYSLSDPLRPERLWSVPVFEPVEGGYVDAETGAVAITVGQSAELGEGVSMSWCDLETRDIATGQVLGRAGPLGLGCSAGPLKPGLAAAYESRMPGPGLTLVDIGDSDSLGILPEAVPPLLRNPSDPQGLLPEDRRRGSVQRLWMEAGTPYLLSRIAGAEEIEVILSLADPERPLALLSSRDEDERPGMLEPVGGGYVARWSGGRVSGHYRLHPDRAESLDRPPPGYLAEPILPVPEGFRIYGRVAQGRVGVLVGPDDRIIVQPLTPELQAQ